MQRTKENGFSPIETILVLVIVGMVSFIGWYVYHARNNANKDLNSAASTSQSLTPASKEASSAAANAAITTKGSDDASLSSDLNSANSSQDQASQDSTAAAGAVNDSQSQISVPTN